MLLKTAKNTSVKQRGEIILIFGSSFQSDSVSLAVVIQKNIFLITDFQSDLESGAALTQNRSHSLADECEELKTNGKVIIL